MGDGRRTERLRQQVRRRLLLQLLPGFLLAGWIFGSTCRFVGRLRRRRFVSPHTLHPLFPSLTYSNGCSVAYQPSAEQQCLTEEEVSNACVQYADRMSELEQTIQTIAPKMRELQSMADEMKAIKLKVQESQPGPDSPELRAAVKRAQLASSEKGAASPEAKVAWAEVEEIASSGLSNAMGTRLDEECLVESAMEACMALDELNRVLNQQRSKTEGATNF